MKLLRQALTFQQEILTVAVAVFAAITGIILANETSGLLIAAAEGLLLLSMMSRANNANARAEEVSLFALPTIFLILGFVYLSEHMVGLTLILLFIVMRYLDWPIRNLIDSFAEENDVQNKICQIAGALTFCGIGIASSGKLGEFGYITLGVLSLLLALGQSSARAHLVLALSITALNPNLKWTLIPLAVLSVGNRTSLVAQRLVTLLLILMIRLPFAEDISMGVAIGLGAILALLTSDARLPNWPLQLVDLLVTSLGLVSIGVVIAVGAVDLSSAEITNFGIAFGAAYIVAEIVARLVRSKINFRITPLKNVSASSIATKLSALSVAESRDVSRSKSNFQRWAALMDDKNWFEKNKAYIAAAIILITVWGGLAWHYSNN